MKKFYAGLVLLAFIAASCHNGSGNVTNKCGPCPLLAANAVALMVVKVKMVDKTTGNNLFLVPGAPYKLTDLKISGSESGNVEHFIVDTLDDYKPFIWLPVNTPQTYTLQLGNLSADHLKIVTGLSDQKCCAVTQVKSISLNDSLVCAPCTAQPGVVIKK